MEFNVDSYIEIGSHDICEDYALHGMIADVPFIVLSDGCSSSEYTDIGSRLMTIAFKRTLTDFINAYPNTEMFDADVFEFIRRTFLFRLQSMLDSLSLKSSVVDATLLYAFVHKGRLYSQMYGDGHIVIKEMDGTVYHSYRSYSFNNPYYLSYELDYVRGKLYDTSTVLNEYVNTIPPTNQKEYLMPYNKPYTLAFDADTIQCVTLFSDGIESFQYMPNAQSRPLENCIKEPGHWSQEMTDYKNTNGDFVKRRMKRISANNTKNSITHYDDLSSASLWITHE